MVASLTLEVFKSIWTCHLGMWGKADYGGVGLAAGLDDLKDLCQLENPVFKAMLDGTWSNVV